MSKIESQKSDYYSVKGYMEPEEIKKMATCPSTHDEHYLYAAAHCLVSERVDKFDLVDMVYAILKREHSEMSKYTLTWTDEPPKEVGKYWWRWTPFSEYRVYNVRLIPTIHGLITYDHKGYHEAVHVEDIDGQWAGPIPEPREPKE